MIASTADAANNKLSTGTLGWDSIDNHASSSAISFNGSYSKTPMQNGEHYVAGALPSAVNMSYSASGTPRSAGADGTITLRDKQNQTQDTETLSRDTDNANGHIGKIFDKEKVENQMAFAQGVQELAGRVVGDVKGYKMGAASDEAKARQKIMDLAVHQRPIPGVPKDPDAPKIVNPTNGQPSVSLELPLKKKPIRSYIGSLV